MGQQQLLLLVLGIIIVAMAVLSGIGAFTQSRRQAEVDIVVERTARLATMAQAWKMRPAALGGGQGRTGFEGVQGGFDALGWPTVGQGITAMDANGEIVTMPVQCYRPDGATVFCPYPQASGPDGELVIFALSTLTNQGGGAITDAQMNVVVTATVSGTRPEDILMEVVR